MKGRGAALAQCASRMLYFRKHVRPRQDNEGIQRTDSRLKQYMGICDGIDRWSAAMSARRSSDCVSKLATQSHPILYPQPTSPRKQRTRRRCMRAPGKGGGAGGAVGARGGGTCPGAECRIIEQEHAENAGQAMGEVNACYGTMIEIVF